MVQSHTQSTPEHNLKQPGKTSKNQETMYHIPIKFTQLSCFYQLLWIYQMETFDAGTRLYAEKLLT